jgi:hypothetical protein
MGINNPFPSPDPQLRIPNDIAFRKFQGRVDQGNVRVRGLSPGTVVTDGSPAGNVDGVHVTVSFPTSSGATQSFSLTHTLGRHPVGVELVNANAGLAIFSATATSATQVITTGANPSTDTATASFAVVTDETNVFLGAQALISAPATATVRIW